MGTSKESLSFLANIGHRHINNPEGTKKATVCLSQHLGLLYCAENTPHPLQENIQYTMGVQLGGRTGGQGKLVEDSGYHQHRVCSQHFLHLSVQFEWNANILSALVSFSQTHPSCSCPDRKLFAILHFNR